MKSKNVQHFLKIYIETIIFLLISVILLIAPLGRNLPNIPIIEFLEINFEHNLNGLFFISFIYGILFLIFSVFSFSLITRGTTITALTFDYVTKLLLVLIENLKSLYELINKHLSNSTWLLISIILASTSAGFFLNQPMRYDESFTFLMFINRGIDRLFYYPLPNNHVFFTLLSKISTFFGGNSPAAIRFPAYLAGIFSLIILYYICKKINTSGIVSLFSYAVFPYLLLYMTNGRGYTLVIFFTLILVVVAFSIIKKGPNEIKSIQLSLFASLGLFTMPSMLFPITGIFIWIVVLLYIEKHTLKRIMFGFIIPFSLLTSFFTIIFYTPVIFFSNGIETILGNRFVQSLSWDKFIESLLPHILITYRDFTRDINNGIILIFIVFISLGIYNFIIKKDWVVLLLLPFLFLGSFIILFIKHAIPFARTWIFFIPFFLIYADAGFNFLIKKFSIQLQNLIIAFVFLFALFFSFSLITNNTITKYKDTGTFPEAQIAAQFLDQNMKNNDQIKVNIPADMPTEYYYWYLSRGKNEVSVSEPEKIYYIVKKSRYNVEEMTDSNVIKLVEIGDMIIYQNQEGE